MPLPAARPTPHTTRSIEGVEIHTVTNEIQQQISEFAGRSLQDALGVPFEVTSADVQTWVNAATDRTEDVKQWDLLQSGSGVGGGTDGTPGTNYLSWFDPKQYALNAFNFHFESPHPEVIEGATIVDDMMSAQNVEFDHEARVQIITDLQRWIMDNAWSIFIMPMAGTAYLGVSSRLRGLRQGRLVQLVLVEQHPEARERPGWTTPRPAFAGSTGTDRGPRGLPRGSSFGGGYVGTRYTGE